MNHVYVVTAYSNAHRDQHSYVVGAFTTQEKAMKAGLAEMAYRGGKYDYETRLIPIDIPIIHEAPFFAVEPLELEKK